MEEKNNKKLKNRIIIAVVSVIVVVVTVVSLMWLYSTVYNDNLKTVQTSSNNEDKKEVSIEEQDSAINVYVDENKEKEKENGEENKQEETEPEQKNELTEEEKQKIAEQEKQKQEQQEKKQEEEQKKYATNYPYYLKVNYTANTVTAYAKDSNGNYTVPVKAMICSTGAATPTSGVYRTLNKYRWKLLIGNSYGQYSTRIVSQILFHSVPCERQSEDSVITRYYDRLGITTSMGCIRLTVADAKWIYDNCPLGTQVEFYSSSNPGPLGKPSAIKITNYGYPLNRWDPTDPNPNNPWKTKNINQNNTVTETNNKTNTSNGDQKNTSTNNKTNTSSGDQKNTSTDNKTNTSSGDKKDTNTNNKTNTSSGDQKNTNTNNKTNTSNGDKKDTNTNNKTNTSNGNQKDINTNNKTNTSNGNQKDTNTNNKTNTSN